MNRWDRVTMLAGVLAVAEAWFLSGEDYVAGETPRDRHAYAKAAVLLIGELSDHELAQIARERAGLTQEQSNEQ